LVIGFAASTLIMQAITWNITVAVVVASLMVIACT